MNWSIQKIETELLSSKIGVLALPPEIVVASVNRAEQVLGANWIASARKGVAPTMQVIGMGIRLTALENLKHSGQLITNLRRRDQNADAELTAIHLFQSSDPSTQVELYPDVGSNKADFRIRRANDKQWTTVEVTQPGSSEERQRLEEILRRIGGSFSKTEDPFSLDIVLTREPSEREVLVLQRRLPEACQQVTGRKRADLPDGLGFLLLNHVDIGNLRLFDVPELANTPMIAVAVFFSGGAGDKPHHQVSLRIPFADERAEEILRGEARQLPKGEPGLVMMNIPMSPTKLPVWVSLIQRRFQPEIHTRVSGVCLFSGSMVPAEDRYKLSLQTKLLTNPHAKVPLPEWVSQTVNSAGEQFDLKLKA
jgi:hypothetical protein